MMFKQRERFDECIQHVPSIFVRALFRLELDDPLPLAGND